MKGGSQNPPAFPHVTQSKRAGSETIYTHVTEGMTLRDWFAGQALASCNGPLNWVGEEAELAMRIYRIADAMLAERSKVQS